MTKAGRVYRPRKPTEFDAYDISRRRSGFRDYAPVAFGGLMLVLAFAFAGHYMGQNAVAHDAVPDQQLAAIAGSAPDILAKGSLLPEGVTFDIININTLAKGSYGGTQSLGGGETVIAKADVNYPAQTNVIEARIVPASIDLRSGGEAAVSKKILLTPPTAKIEASYRLKRSDQLTDGASASLESQKVLMQRRFQLAEENCLARAVYFEARSETDLGQLAVAKVILNRVKDPNYPKTICGVVYQGSGSRNSCQFSFACDGLPDDVRSPAAWAHSKAIAEKAMAGDASVAAIGLATNYHADYVTPRWAHTMRRLIKIGHHIFYSDT